MARRAIRVSVGRVQALDRGLRILDLLTEADADPLRRASAVQLQQVANELEIHKSTASRLLQTLIDRGYAESVQGRRGYRLGSAMRPDRELGYGPERFRETARPFLRELVEEIGEGAHAAVAVGDRVLVVDDVETDQPLRVVPVPGRHVPLHCTSAGKCLLAFGLADLPASMPRRTVRTITNRDVLRAQLAEIRERGYAIDDEENDSHVRCISAPVFGSDGRAIGCIGVDGPSVRMTLDRIPDVARCVADIARRMSTVLSGGREGATDRSLDLEEVRQ
jgi:DNA-binding IclR family transcriptional regulator